MTTQSDRFYWSMRRRSTTTCTMHACGYMHMCRITSAGVCGGSISLSSSACLFLQSAYTNASFSQMPHARFVKRQQSCAPQPLRWRGLLDRLLQIMSVCMASKAWSQFKPITKSIRPSLIPNTGAHSMLLVFAG